MSVQAGIGEKLQQAFNPSYLQVENESFRHNVPPGSESHFKVVLVSADFAAMKTVARHQSVYKTLAQELQTGVHALALHLYTPAEWDAKQQHAPQSPDCRGGGR